MNTVKNYINFPIIRTCTNIKRTCYPTERNAPINQCNPRVIFFSFYLGNWFSNIFSVPRLFAFPKR